MQRKDLGGRMQKVGFGRKDAEGWPDVSPVRLDAVSRIGNLQPQGGRSTDRSID